MKKDMPLEGLRWSRDSGSALYDTPQNGRSRTGCGGSLLITSKLPLMYERRILVLLLKSYIQYILCLYVYMYSRIHEYTFKPILATQRL